jgi:hypothetical protein
MGRVHVTVAWQTFSIAIKTDEKSEGLSPLAQRNGVSLSLNKGTTHEQVTLTFTFIAHRASMSTPYCGNDAPTANTALVRCRCYSP